jgi:hypothetical protein
LITTPVRSSARWNSPLIARMWRLSVDISARRLARFVSGSRPASSRALSRTRASSCRAITIVPMVRMNARETIIV